MLKTDRVYKVEIKKKEKKNKKKKRKTFTL